MGWKRSDPPVAPTDRAIPRPRPRVAYRGRAAGRISGTAVNHRAGSRDYVRRREIGLQSQP
jgi:hypothetical protein